MTTEPQAKRLMLRLPPPQQDPLTAALAVLGTRVRRSVHGGYATNPEASYIGSRRVPLPGHMSQPPALVSDGLTFELGLSFGLQSNLGLWQPTVPEPVCAKRPHSETVLDHPEFGELTFNEDF